jgi:hypothetical protein
MAALCALIAHVCGCQNSFTLDGSVSDTGKLFNASREASSDIVKPFDFDIFTRKSPLPPDQYLLTALKSADPYYRVGSLRHTFICVIL